ncbi:MAG: AtpZ/AtpI family protein [Acetobacteraceae bacterium]|nr:AtpZ/AtpI family protein [Acetobacteraceae bacterium]
MNDDAKNAGQAGTSFEARLAAARTRQGLDPKPLDISKGDTKGPSPMSVGLRVGVELLSALIVGASLGYWLDRWLHTSPMLLSLFVLLGGAGGIANVWRLLGPKPPAH